MLLRCPVCIGDGFTGWSQYKFKKKQRIYKKLCSTCLGEGKVDWITNATHSPGIISDAIQLINVKLCKRFENYCFNFGGSIYYVNKEFVKDNSTEEQWRNVIMNTSFFTK